FRVPLLLVYSFLELGWQIFAPYNLNRLFLTGTIPVIPSILTDSMKPHYIYSVKGCIYFDRSPNEKMKKSSLHSSLAKMKK
ncbi:hypothetical protein, partial [Dehalobacter restrictus]|uniref:hypothetical protein n=1 Tax=Dehalobacter restrictus TaxID=55583 RepID=UPI003014F10B